MNISGDITNMFVNAMVNQILLLQKLTVVWKSAGVRERLGDN